MRPASFSARAKRRHASNAKTAISVLDDDAQRRLEQGRLAGRFALWELDSEVWDSIAHVPADVQCSIVDEFLETATRVGQEKDAKASLLAQISESRACGQPTKPRGLGSGDSGTSTADGESSEDVAGDASPRERGDSFEGRWARRGAAVGSEGDLLLRIMRGEARGREDAGGRQQLEGALPHGGDEGQRGAPTTSGVASAGCWREHAWDSPKQRAERMERAQDIIAACPNSAADAGLASRWQSHLESSKDPEKEARKVMLMMARLHMQGYCGSSASASPVLSSKPSAAARQSEVWVQALGGAGGAGAQPQQFPRDQYWVSTSAVWLSGTPRAWLGAPWARSTSSGQVEEPAIEAAGDRTKDDEGDSLLRGLLKQLKMNDSEAADDRVQCQETTMAPPPPAPPPARAATALPPPPPPLPPPVVVAEDVFSSSPGLRAPHEGSQELAKVEKKGKNKMGRYGL
mmetsp:Transcript_146180/g.371068  ORF Transcript_146180/g.371068 Transcript_146180/m.371068 type:complete len:460 (+) Transcript_146180:128-1507(+)